jgi:uroporphyrinogen-III decarboxylase
MDYEASWPISSRYHITTLFKLIFKNNRSDLSAEFREMRTKNSFFDLCQNPQLACEVTMMVKIDRAKLNLALFKI